MQQHIQAGARVVMLEKAYEPGGTTAHSEGVVWTSERWEELREQSPNGDPVVQRTVFDNLPGPLTSTTTWALRAAGSETLPAKVLI
ncbi:MAG TPA: hypothetical protein QGI39_13605 [Gammaproteobacteria bacterium]|nr:hypothetical protein [Gammaproteobacteria bacterium]